MFIRTRNSLILVFLSDSVRLKESFESFCPDNSVTLVIFQRIIQWKHNRLTRDMMKCLVVTLTLVGVATAAFQRSPPVSFLLRQVPSSSFSPSSSALLASSSSSSLDKDFVRAVECATKFNLCSLEELEHLATKLDNMEDECVFEKSVLCEKEIEDRKDVAEVLRLQSELRLRMDYIENANLFSEDVIKEHDILERDELMEILSEDAM